MGTLVPLFPLFLIFDQFILSCPIKYRNVAGYSEYYLGSSSANLYHRVHRINMFKSTSKIKQMLLYTNRRGVLIPMLAS